MSLTNIFFVMYVNLQSVRRPVYFTYCAASVALFFILCRILHKNSFFRKTKTVYSTEQKGFTRERYFRNGCTVRHSIMMIRDDITLNKSFLLMKHGFIRQNMQTWSTKKTNTFAPAW
jgi:hypothetical protein